MTGFVYAMRCLGRIKIGFTSSVARRIKVVETYCPAPCEFLGVIPGTQADETELHKRFHLSRAHGEWFFDCADIREWVATLNRSVPDCAGRRRPLNASAGSELASARKRLGLTQSALAARLDTTQFVVSRLENGVNPPSIGLAAGIERELGIPASLWIAAASPAQRLEGAA